MKTFLAPNGEWITVPEGRVITFGLSAEQNKVVLEALPARDFEVFETDQATDLVVISSSTVIIRAAAMDAEDQELFFSYCAEVLNQMEETVFWLGDPLPPPGLQAKIKCYQSFDEIAANMKYHLLSAYRKAKRARDFSRKLADCLQILSLIRQHPGIRTQELSKQLELPVRTVQRYISTLQAAGEWIEYDTAKKGWRLQCGISILFGDHLHENH